MKQNFVLLLILLLNNILIAQIPKRLIIDPYNDSLGFGNKYKNQVGLFDLRDIEKKEDSSYFNNDDFRDFEPVGEIIADAPYRCEKEVQKIPDDKLHFYHRLSIDSLMLKRLSKLLFQANEPILTKFYTGKETYRFIWTRAFNNAYIVRIINGSDTTTLIVKKFEKYTDKLLTTTVLLT